MPVDKPDGQTKTLLRALAGEALEAAAVVADAAGRTLSAGIPRVAGAGPAILSSSV